MARQREIQRSGGSSYARKRKRPDLRRAASNEGSEENVFLDRHNRARRIDQPSSILHWNLRERLTLPALSSISTNQDTVQRLNAAFDTLKRGPRRPMPKTPWYTRRDWPSLSTHTSTVTSGNHATHNEMPFLEHRHDDSMAGMQAQGDMEQMDPPVRDVTREPLHDRHRMFTLEREPSPALRAQVNDLRPFSMSLSPTFLISEQKNRHNIWSSQLSRTEGLPEAVDHARTAPFNLFFSQMNPMHAGQETFSSTTTASTSSSRGTLGARQQEEQREWLDLLATLNDKEQPSGEPNHNSTSPILSQSHEEMYRG